MDGGLRVRLKLLGDFELRIGRKRLTFGLSRSKHAWELISYLILNRGRDLPQQELVDMLWADGDYANPAGALKTLMYRTRALLEPHCGEAQPIESVRGAYRWNGEIGCEVDAEEFERVCAAAKSAADADAKLALMREAAELYAGEFLPKFSDKPWVSERAARYRELYVELICEGCRVLSERGEYGEAARLCAQAEEAAPGEQRLHVEHIRALEASGRFAAAEKLCEAAARMFSEPSDELHELCEASALSGMLLDTALSGIGRELAGAAAESGAAVCDMDTFRLLYRLEARRGRRSGMGVSLALMAVGNADEMEILTQAVTSSLGRGEAAARYSDTQLLLMLPEVVLDSDGNAALERVVERFARLGGAGVRYRLRRLGADR